MRRWVEEYLVARGVEREIAWEAFCAVGVAVMIGALVGFVFAAVLFSLA